MSGASSGDADAPASADPDGVRGHSPRENTVDGHANGAPALVVDGAVKRYGSTTAIDGISLELTNSNILALVGPSGCGKSTLLRSIAGLTHLDEGSIRINGMLVEDSKRRVPPEKRSVGLVFQEHTLFPHLSVVDNVMFGIRDVGRRVARQRASEALTVVELADFHDRYPHELSGGERQRVALARALAPRPALMLFDEPFASLDPNLRTQLRHHVIGALRATGTPAVFVTHDQDEALAVGDDLAVMRSGRIEQTGPPPHVFHEPANRFVAAYLGEASFLPIIDGGAGPVTALGPVVEGAAAVGAEVAMVRPDDVKFIPDPDGEAVVSAIEFRGGTWSCSITLADGTTVVSNRSHVDPVVIGARGRVELTPGHPQIPIPADR